MRSQRRQSLVDLRALGELEVAMLEANHDLRLFASSLARGETHGSSARRARARPDVETMFALADRTGIGDVLEPRVRELAIEHAAIDARGSERKRLARERWGDGTTRVVWRGREVAVSELAREIVRDPRSFAFGVGVDAGADPNARMPVRDADAVDPDPLARLTRFAAVSGLNILVRFEPSLVAEAAAGERTLHLRPRALHIRDVVRLAAHEIHGHLVAAENATLQPLLLLRIGCAGSWEDQEGVSLTLEAAAGALDDARATTLAARTLAVECWLDGADEAETARALERDFGVPAETACVSARRTHRSSGTARDLAYLVGYARVRTAIDAGAATLDELRMGRVSVSALPTLRRLASAGLVVSAAHRPSLAVSLRETFSGTSFATSPPSRAASLTRFDDT